MVDQNNSEKSTNQIESQKTNERKAPADKVSAAGWGLFFIWVGISFLAGLHTGVVILGIGVITLVAQAVRKSLNLEIEKFWVIVGLLFVIGGVCSLLELSIPKLPLVPILLIVAGVLLLLSLVRGTTKKT